MLSEEQRTTVQTKVFYNAMVAEIKSVLDAMKAKKVGFDGHLFLDITGIPVAVEAKQLDLVIHVGAGEREDPNSAPYNLTVPVAWITG